MSDSGRSGFLSRWSQRKIQARENRQVRDEDPAAERALATQAGQPAAEAGPDAASSADSVASETSIASRHDAVPRAGQSRDNPLPSLEDVKFLTPESDFSPFMARGVAPAVKNAAMKKLFADPHFNVMDGLDIYIDDYTQRDILPESMMRKMASSKFLRMFTDEDEAQPSTTATPAPCAGHETGGQDAVPGQDCPQNGYENSATALTGVVSSPDEVRTDAPETGTPRAGTADMGSPDTVIPPAALPQEVASAAFSGVRVSGGGSQAGTQAAAALGVSPGLPPSLVTGQNRLEASRTSIAKSETPLGEAPSDAKPHERSN